MKIVNYQKRFERYLIELIAKFRIDLRKLKGLESEIDLKNAEEELKYYQRRQFPIFWSSEMMEILLVIQCAELTME